MACPARGLDRLLWFLAVTVAAVVGTAFILSILHQDGGHDSLPYGAFVEVVGADGRAAVYMFDTPPRVPDAMAAAGGRQQPTGSNRQVLKSGSALYVMPDGTVRRGIMSGGHLMDLGIPVPVNEAEGTDLEAIPGIGPALAGRIVLDRMKNGPFRSLSDLSRVKGIGPAKTALLKEYVSF